jgi:membrane associated rhomboid family serine protease
MQSPDEVVLTLVGVNVAIFMLWRVADPGFMSRHFMVSEVTNWDLFLEYNSGYLIVVAMEQISLDNFKSGRLHTLLTSAFSHAESDHLISNMIGLYFFGTSVSYTLFLYVTGRHI